MKRLARLLLLLLVLVLAGMVVAQDAGQLSKSAIVRRLLNEVFTGTDGSLLETAFVPDAVWRRAGDSPVSLTDWQAEMTALVEAMPGLDTRSLALLTDGDFAAVLTRFDGTFTAPLTWQGTTLTPNDAEIEWLQLDILRFMGGRVVEVYSERNTDILLAQLGAVSPGPQPVQAAQAARAAVAGQGAQAAVVAVGLDPAQEQANADALSAFLASALVNPDVAALEPLFTDDFVLHLPGGDASLNALADLLIRLKTALPDALLSYPALLIDENMGAARLMTSGVFMGEWTDSAGTAVAASGLPVTLSANLLVRFNDESAIAEAWLVYDSSDWTAQFMAGPLPSPETPG